MQYPVVTKASSSKVILVQVYNIFGLLIINRSSGLDYSSEVIERLKKIIIMGDLYTSP